MLPRLLRPRRHSKRHLYRVRRDLSHPAPTSSPSSRIPLCDMIIHFPDQMVAQQHSLAGTPTHSAISSSTPPSPIHSSLQVNILLVPQHIAKLPFRTGFHRAYKTGFVCMRILRNLGVNGSEGEGKEYIWITVGTFSTNTKRSTSGR